jgi:hypothetical protein
MKQMNVIETRKEEFEFQMANFRYLFSNANIKSNKISKKKSLYICMSVCVSIRKMLKYECVCSTIWAEQAIVSNLCARWQL